MTYIKETVMFAVVPSTMKANDTVIIVNGIDTQSSGSYQITLG